MNKKPYQQPALRVVAINIRHQLLSGSPVNKVGGNAGLTGAGDDGTITGGSGPARSRSNSGWDGWDDEE